MACEAFSRAMWALLVFVTSIVLTLAFATSSWIETKSSVLALGYDRISLGLIHGCLQRIGDDEVCGQYGHGLQDIPITSWRSAALFYGSALFLSWLAFLLCMISFFRSDVKYALKYLTFSSFALVGLSLFIFGASLGELKYHNNASIFQMCSRASAFDPGPACTLGDSGVIACLGLGLLGITAVSGAMVDTEQPNSTSQEEEEAAQRKLSA